MSADEGIGTINSFIKVGEMIEKLPRLTLPEYQDAALDLAKICFKLLNGTKIAVSWFMCLSNFQFIRDPVIAKQEYLKMSAKYRNLRSGGTFKKLDIACGDLNVIYQNHLEGSLNMMFSDKSKSELDDVRGVFYNLSKSDNNLVAFVSKHIVSKLDSFTNDIDRILMDPQPSYYSDQDRLKSAEEKKLEFNRDSRDIINQLIHINDALIDLVIKFASKTDTGISHIFDPSDFNKTDEDVC